MACTWDPSRLARLQHVQDLLSQVHGIFLLTYGPNGDALTLPSGLPSSCSTLVQQGACLRALLRKPEHTCTDGRWCRRIDVDACRGEPVHGKPHFTVVCGAQRPCPPQVVELVEAIFQLVAGGSLVAEPLVGAGARTDGSTAPAPRRASGTVAAPPGVALKGLTRREAQVLRLVAEGLSNREIAHRLFVTESTVKTHLFNVFRKCGIANRAQAAALAVREAPPA